MSLAPIIVQSYEGDTNRAGVYHGTGTALFHGGDVYHGNFSNGLMHGQGEYVWKDGVAYKGSFSENKLEGPGTYKWDDNVSYTGMVSNNLRDGKGTLQNKPINGEYTGEWRKGKREGKGLQYYDEKKTVYYDGQWRKDKKQGKGLMRYASGNTYDGEWECDVKHGSGTMIWRNRREIFVGEWNRGVICGKGTYIWEVGPSDAHQFPLHNRYEGFWKDGKRHGHGTFQYSSGARYVGEWSNNMKHGTGSYISEDGRTYIGEFKNDRMVGEYPKYSNDCPFIFNMSQLISSELQSARNEILSSINAVFLRHIVILRRLYKWYTTEYAPYQSANSDIVDDFHHSSSLSRLQLWKFWRESGITARGFSLVILDRTIVQHLENVPLSYHRYQEPHNPKEPIIFHHFLECLLRAAHLVYSHTTDKLSIDQNGIAVCLDKLIQLHICTLPVATNTGLDGSSPNTEGSLPFKGETNRLLLQVQKKFQEPISAIFDQWAQRHLKSLPRSNGDRTVTARELFYILKECKMFNSSLTVKRLLDLLITEIPVIVDDDAFNLEHEIVCHEFLIVIFGCSVISLTLPSLPSAASTKPVTPDSVNRQPLTESTTGIPAGITDPATDAGAHHEKEKEKSLPSAKDLHHSATVPAISPNEMAGTTGNKTKEKDREYGFDAVGTAIGAHGAAKDSRTSTDGKPGAKDKLNKDRDHAATSKEKEREKPDKPLQNQLDKNSSAPIPDATFGSRLKGLLNGAANSRSGVIAVASAEGQSRKSSAFEPIPPKVEPDKIVDEAVRMSYAKMSEEDKRIAVFNFFETFIDVHKKYWEATKLSRIYQCDKYP